MANLYNNTSSSNLFVNATQARKDSRNNSVIHSEVRSIESAVIANIDSGVLLLYNCNSDLKLHFKFACFIK